MRFKDRVQRFMIGRYGTDQLSRALLAVSMIFLILSLFTTKLLYIIAIVLLVLTYFRMFSRNISKRYAENQKYLNLKYKLTAKTNQKKKEWQQRKIYSFFHCPSCKQKVRVPKGKGKICITCPKCKTEFIKVS